MALSNSNYTTVCQLSRDQLYHIIDSAIEQIKSRWSGTDEEILTTLLEQDQDHG